MKFRATLNIRNGEVFEVDADFGVSRLTLCRGLEPFPDGYTIILGRTSANSLDTQAGVIPSLLSSDERSELQELHGLCWNTEDDFGDDVSADPEIMEFHRSLGSPHWYLPFHKTLNREQFTTEMEAYEAAKRASKEIN